MPRAKTESEEVRVIRWRIRELERAGYSERAAIMLAAREDVDLHRAVELLKAGCDENVALLILL